LFFNNYTLSNSFFLAPRADLSIVSNSEESLAGGSVSGSNVSSSASSGSGKGFYYDASYGSALALGSVSGARSFEASGSARATALASSPALALASVSGSA